MSPFWIILIVVFILVLLAVAYVARLMLRRISTLTSSLDLVVLLVLLPRQVSGTADNKQPGPEKEVSDQLSVAEVLWSAIGGLKAQGGLISWFKGRSDQISLEMVVQNNMISFYVVVPSKMRSFIEQEIHAVYPNAVLQEVPDYNIFLPRGISVGTSLKLSRSSAFPVKTYKQFESDPLESLINALVKVQPPAAAALQLVVRSAAKSWRRSGVKIASAMQQGKSLNQVEHSNALGKAGAVLGDFFGPTKKDKKEENKSYRLSPMEEQMIKGIEEKATKAGLDVTCRLVVSAPDQAIAQAYLSNLANSFNQFSIYQYGNKFELYHQLSTNSFLRSYIYRAMDEAKSFVLNTEELTTIYHFPLSSNDNPQIRWLTSRHAPAPSSLPSTGIILGINEYRGQKLEVRMLPEDRARHFYIIGKSGTGKSVLLENLAIQDIKNGEGVCIIDPHGDLVDAVLSRIPKERQDDVIIFDPADIERPQGLNLLEYDPRYPEQKTFVINEMIKILDKLYDLRQTGGPMFEQYMRNAMLLIMDDVESGATLMEISKVLSDPDFRRYKLSKVKNPVVHDFWVKEAQKAGGDAALANMVPYITSKLNQFVSNDIMRPIIGQQQSAFNFRQVMDQKKILLVRLAKGKLGDLNSYLLGLVIVGKILMASLSRTDLPEYQRQNFYLYIDEFQNFITDSIAVILSEARKYKLNLTIAHQYIGQLVSGNDTRIRDAVFGNVGTIACFRVGVEDADVLAKEFAPVFSAYDLINIELFQAYLKLLVHNTPARPFNIATIKPELGNIANLAAIRELSRRKYGRDRIEVEKEIIERSQRGLGSETSVPFGNSQSAAKSAPGNNPLAKE